MNGKDILVGKEGVLTRTCALLRRFLSDRQGIGGVEFALLAPMLIVIYLCAFELMMGFSVAKKATAASSTIADLVSRAEKSVSKNDLAGMVDVADAIFVPYSVNNLSLKITGVKVDANKQATVAWSWSNTGAAPYVVGATVKVPDDMLIASTFLVHSELSVGHELLLYLPALSGQNIKNITIPREFFFRQRVGNNITCNDC
ncbi:TadE/TadG family type IV pilus assembly protein [Paenirhizobium daejeonense]|uniref:TadE/TadG family type IV pilus assembly protein n=1 Tax=Rhizobium daejeonense TaxID=240521 RepID=UPI001FEB29CC|nr:TadE/TadG family type IV pilus assembly protein [Rhizobium daejeonense]